MGAHGKEHNMSHFSLEVDICMTACMKMGKKRGKYNFCRTILFLVHSLLYSVIISYSLYNAG